LNGAPDLSRLPEALKQSILREALQRQQEMLEGVRQYLHYNQDADSYPAPPETVWSSHAAKLYHYPSQGITPPKHPLLIIPSLINRYYILDLSEERSLVRYLAAQGHDVYLLDWGTPGASEQAFGLEEYVAQVLAPSAEFVRDKHDTSPSVAGYCMGGLIALILASQRPDLVARLVLLATPWNFHAQDNPQARFSEERISTLESMLSQAPCVPGEVILYLFYLRDPWRFQQKFRDFPHIKNKAARQYFSAVERWANDCVPLPRKVAVESFIHCQHRNLPYLGQWRVGGTLITPSTIDIPTLIAAPHNDRIVSPGSALALAEQLPRVKLHQPKTGHIGMITGSRRLSQLWQPLQTWLAD
jgi:class III poly(R)-hydroxyalkanoic acid synthase PhaC subunit